MEYAHGVKCTLGVLHESFTRHLRYKRLKYEKSNRGLRASRSTHHRRCEIMAPATHAATMAGPTKGKEGCAGCLGTVGEA